MKKENRCEEIKYQTERLEEQHSRKIYSNSSSLTTKQCSALLSQFKISEKFIQLSALYFAVRSQLNGPNKIFCANLASSNHILLCANCCLTFLVLPQIIFVQVLGVFEKAFSSFRELMGLEMYNNMNQQHIRQNASSKQNKTKTT